LRKNIECRYYSQQQDKYWMLHYYLIACLLYKTQKYGNIVFECVKVDYLRSSPGKEQLPANYRGNSQQGDVDNAQARLWNAYAKEMVYRE
jgi:hypothetical protein